MHDFKSLKNVATQKRTLSKWKTDWPKADLPPNSTTTNYSTTQTHSTQLYKSAPILNTTSYDITQHVSLSSRALERTQEGPTP